VPSARQGLSDADYSGLSKVAVMDPFFLLGAFSGRVMTVLLLCLLVGGCFQQENELDTKDDEACRQAVQQNPQGTYEDCRRDATAKRNAPQTRHQSGSGY
jgi:hypothetical protein